MSTGETLVANACSRPFLHVDPPYAAINSIETPKAKRVPAHMQLLSLPTHTPCSKAPHTMSMCDHKCVMSLRRRFSCP